MYLITISPIARGISHDALTYFTKKELTIGMIIMVPVRNRKIPGIVLSSQLVCAEKESLKSIDYPIRKIEAEKPRTIWSRFFIQAVQKTTNLTAQKFGESLLALTPKVILDARLVSQLPTIKVVNLITRQPVNSSVQADTKTRIEHYRLIIQESFAKNKSVFICLPTKNDILRLVKALEDDFKNYTFVFHSSMSKKNILIGLEKVCANKKPVLVIGTAPYLNLPRYFNTIILDEEGSPSWKMITRPYIDMRIFIEEYARATNANLIIGASLLRVETYKKAIDNGQLIMGNEKGGWNRSQTKNEKQQTNIIDPRDEEKKLREIGKKTLVVIGEKICEIIKYAQKSNELTFLLVARTGLAPITMCDDCGTLICCSICDAPLVLHKQSKILNLKLKIFQIFMCHSCGNTQVPEEGEHEACPQCAGSNLKGIGIGVDLVTNEITKINKNIPCFILDGNHAKTSPQAKKIITEFEKSTNGILIGTPMAIPFLNTIPNTAIISIDSLFAIPNIRMPERIVSLILALREKTTKTMVIQSRADDTTILNQAIENNLEQFLKQELSIHKIFSYPPYGTIIKITLHGTQNNIKYEMEQLKTFLQDYKPIVQEIKKTKNQYHIHIVLKLSEWVWPNFTLLKKLLTLPDQFTVEINPDSLI